ncbi:uncharacterized protein MYCFIDRAFT_177921 [Pseudocercospora fijiensis CIRAD86]|uniref:Uncharacterized protein n=1 Tax=Pseudocercospora fijiensis (strain CIRAD86) TaxID=383855 RepID=M2ZJN2_PSEFD|nr:uncharacterized protein MYCFIDRAFT_177921 [Pseudocercospora fijiensis CIRAD86]EME79299.1 hypothetical protein MYCFIDRAFT_177921 [Pseudocercospora fijiensis CIRAD86]
MPLPAKKAADEVCGGCAHLLLRRIVADELVNLVTAGAQVSGVMSALASLSRYGVEDRSFVSVLVEVTVQGGSRSSGQPRQAPLHVSSTSHIPALEPDAEITSYADSPETLNLFGKWQFTMVKESRHDSGGALPFPNFTSLPPTSFASTSFKPWIGDSSNRESCWKGPYVEIPARADGLNKNDKPLVLLLCAHYWRLSNPTITTIQDPLAEMQPRSPRRISTPCISYRLPAGRDLTSTQHEEKDI